MSIKSFDELLQKFHDHISKSTVTPCAEERLTITLRTRDLAYNRSIPNVWLEGMPYDHHAVLQQQCQ
ncbi:hypothetical protein ACI65C_004059 [Semiaphis heraclei]